VLDDFGWPEALVADVPATLGHVRLAATYPEAYPDEICKAIADSRRTFADGGVLFSFVAVADGWRGCA
jgi:hypothetical protein